MSRIDIEYGSLASSEILNNNFIYLEELISGFQQVIQTNKSSLESQISTVNNNVNSKIEEVKLNVPTGTIMPMPIDVTPDGFLDCEGQAVSRTTYENLFNIIGTKYGAGDNITTFNVPDFRGMFLRGKGGKSKGFNELQKSAVPNHYHDGIYFGGSNADNGDPGGYATTAGGQYNGDRWYHNGRTSTVHQTTSETENQIYRSDVSEVRPDNYAVHYIIKY